MATVTAFIRTTKTDKNKSINVRFRLRDGREFQLFHKSEIFVFPDKWDKKQQKIKARCIIEEQQRKDFDKAVSDRKNLIKEIYLQKGQTLTSDILESEIDKVLHPEQYEQSRQTFFDAFNEFLTKHPLSEVRQNNYRVVLRALQRFEVFTKKTVPRQKNFVLDINSVNADTLKQFEVFLTKEHEYCYNFPELYLQFLEHRPNEPRGKNTLASIFSKLRTFFNWCNHNGITQNKPFDKYSAPIEIYGTPYYLTIEERNTLYRIDCLKMRHSKDRETYLYFNA
ncbi:MAG: phage integrase SAM-like domain-containing protein [Prevotellaceae bacterium]|jgi:hypothetical protein|nr:phage integrase SAM-like domain-containing protein [Prevotellaceae bacterium]